MKYYTIECTQADDGTYAQTIFIHDSLDAAIAKFHEFMHYQMIVGTTKKALCMVISEQGVQERTETWEKHTVVETEETDNTETDES